MGMNHENDRLFFRALTVGEIDQLCNVCTDVENRPGIYCIFNSESKMMYIGCTNSVSTRIATHRGHLERGQHICKRMQADYIKSKDSFLFFCLEYVEPMQTQEYLRTVLLSKETQYMKRVSVARLYNNLLPVSLEEKALLAEPPAVPTQVPIVDICRRLDMSPDSIRANGYSITDSLSLPDAIEFVRKRTVASGRWTDEKAELAKEYLSELIGMEPESKTSVSDLYLSNGDHDYFGDMVVQVPKRRISIESIRSGLLSIILLAVIIGHGALIWYDCATLWGTAGLIGGGVVFLIVLAAVLLASDETRIRTSGTALYFALCIDISAWWVHFPTFQRADVSDVITGALCAFLCACSWIALFLYRDKNID